MPKGIANKYYYVLYKIKNENDEEFFMKYFRSTAEIAEYLNICRMSVFNIIKNKHNSHLSRIYVIEKLDEPVDRYVKIEIDDEV
jgi:predicted DNA-binding protein YlxM (UPF0122 family)